MAIQNPIYSGVKVSKESVQAVKDMVKGHSYYQLDDKAKMKCLKHLNATLAEQYGVCEPSLHLNRASYNHYNPNLKHIVVESPSIISYLHEFRHHLQHEANKKYKGMTIEQDARAWSMRIFSIAFPKMFEKAVKNNKVIHIKWSETENRIVDDARYI